MRFVIAVGTTDGMDLIQVSYNQGYFHYLSLHTITIACILQFSMTNLQPSIIYTRIMPKTLCNETVVFRTSDVMYVYIHVIYTASCVTSITQVQYKPKHLFSDACTCSKLWAEHEQDMYAVKCEWNMSDSCCGHAEDSGQDSS